MTLKQKFAILASRYGILELVWFLYTLTWLVADQNPPYNFQTYLTVSGVIALLGLLNTSTMLVYHWRHK